MATRKRKLPAAPAPVPVSPRVPDSDERKAIAVAAGSVLKRKRRFNIELTGNVMSATHDDTNGFSARAMDAFGTSSPEFASHIMGRLSVCLRAHQGDGPSTQASQQEINAALAFVDGYEPANEVEAMAAATLYAANDMALVMLARAKQATDIANLEVAASVALRLLRATTAQMEALAKLKRGGEQTVRVEHVHVHAGGQAIVGNVTGGGGAGNSIGQSHEPGRSPEGVTPLLGVDPAGDVVSVAGHAERALSDSRRA